jgi:hypothetical protein
MDQKTSIRWLLKEILGYKHNLVTLEELQSALLSIAQQTDNLSDETQKAILNLESKLEEIKYTTDTDQVYTNSLFFVQQVEKQLLLIK